MFLLQTQSTASAGPPRSGIGPSGTFLRVRSPLLVVQRFLPHFFLPTDLLLEGVNDGLLDSSQTSPLLPTFEITTQSSALRDRQQLQEVMCTDVDKRPSPAAVRRTESDSPALMRLCVFRIVELQRGSSSVSVPSMLSESANSRHVIPVTRAHLKQTPVSCRLDLCLPGVMGRETVHHGESLYAWIDPENVSWRIYKFYDVTSTIFVDASPPQPSIRIYGGVQTGDAITVVCSTLHTCPYSKPNITLNNIKGSDETDNKHIVNGLWEITLTRTGVTNAENTTIECSVTHYGGITVTAMKSINPQPPGHEEVVPIPLMTDWLYILVPSLVCILVGIIIHKSRHRQTSGDMHGSEERVEALLVRERVTLYTAGPELLEGPQLSPKSALAVSVEKLFLPTAVLNEEDCPLTPQTAECCREDPEDQENPVMALSAGARLLWILSKSSAPETGDLTHFARGPSVSRGEIKESKSLPLNHSGREGRKSETVADQSRVNHIRSRQQACVFISADTMTANKSGSTERDSDDVTVTF
ncbi:hypothetical protein Q8A67_020143 [Cirrhinus molitorella]|uniref:Ig-like domain-containing protein n=1 Tax=Cirrhinus molitorella TaxID=172907 RepID=A0AA88P8C4_9TELE|nr:hypothetical protein Q8A67_020143 [Cirrhinus molitorella]